MKKLKLNIFLAFVGVCVLALASSCEKDQSLSTDVNSKVNNKKGVATSASLPTLTGKLVYHKYDC